MKSEFKKKTTHLLNKFCSALYLYMQW